ncbi:MAG: T9SS type A sorting domain-containing protein [Muribaculaceae bacterium]|nr:T9SS type A sorting domain-containing protein [Muribaculaceae bacterium]
MRKLIIILLGVVTLGIGLPCHASYYFDLAKTVEVSKCGESGMRYRSINNVSLNDSADEDAVEFGEIAYRLSYKEGVLTMVWYNVCTTCGFKYNNVAREIYPDNRFDFHLIHEWDEWDDWDGPVADCLCMYNVTASYDDFTPGHYLFAFDYVFYDVELKEDLDIILRKKDASPEWEYSSHKKLSSCRSAFEDPSDYYQQVTGDASIRPDYRIKYDNGKMCVTWYDLVEDCDVNYVGAAYRKGRDKMSFIIQPYFRTEFAACRCRYDLTTTFENIQPGDYNFDLSGKEIPLHLSEGTDVLVADGNILTEVESINIEDAAFFVSNDILTINSHSDYQCEIFNFEGVRIANIQGSGRDEIDLGTLSHGIYVIHMVVDGRKISTRIHL